ncbi:Nn.00g023430.m01.CDS01 [Neocucurbitaria sp. VM-36]
MAIISVVAMTGLIIGSIALAKGQYMERTQNPPAASNLQSVTPTMWQTSPTTGEASVMASIVIITAHSSDLETTTKASSSTRVSKSISRTIAPPITTEDSTKRIMLGRREETVVTVLDDPCASLATMNPSTLLPNSFESPRTSSILSSTQSNVGGPRFHAPFAWATLRKRWLAPQHAEPIKPPTPVSTKAVRDEIDEDAVEKLVNIASSNAAVARLSLPWLLSHSSPSTTIQASIDRRQQAGKNLSYWEAYSQLRQQAAVLCFATNTYLDPVLTPSHVKNADDDDMANIVNEKLCNKMGQEFALVAQGKKCETRDGWEKLKKSVEELCAAKMVGKVIVQSLNLLCTTKTSLESNIGDCGADGLGSTGVASGSASTQSMQSMGMTSRVLPSASPLSLSIQLPSSTQRTFANFSFASSTIPVSDATSDPSIPTLITSSPYLGASPSSAVPAFSETSIGPPSTSPATTCPSSISQLTFATPALWSTAIITSIPPWTGPSSGFNLTAHGPSPTAGIPCGYTTSHDTDPTIIPTVVVPATTQTGELTFYNSGDAYIADPACGPEGVKLQPNEAAVAIGWELFDYTNAMQKKWPENSLCGRKIVAWCERNADGDGEKERSEVSLWVRDRCAGCRPQDLDVLDGVFPFCNDVGVGRAPVTWNWVEDGGVETK